MVTTGPSLALCGYAKEYRGVRGNSKVKQGRLKSGLLSPPRGTETTRLLPELESIHRSVTDLAFAIGQQVLRAGPAGAE